MRQGHQLPTAVVEMGRSADLHKKLETDADKPVKRGGKPFTETQMRSHGISVGNDTVFVTSSPADGTKFLSFKRREARMEL